MNTVTLLHAPRLVGPGRIPPKADRVKRVPNARPLSLAAYISAMMLCAHGMTSASPRPFRAVHTAACPNRAQPLSKRCQRIGNPCCSLEACPLLSNMGWPYCLRKSPLNKGLPPQHKSVPHIPFLTNAMADMRALEMSPLHSTGSNTC